VTSFGKLVEEQLPRLRRYALALLRDPDKADDLVQVRFFARSRRRTFISRTRICAPGSSPFCTTNTSTAFASSCGRARRRISMTSKPRLRRRLELNDLDRAVARLPHDQRTVLLLIGLEGMKYDEVADILGVPVGAVRSRLSRARADLRDMLSEEPGRSPLRSTVEPNERRFAVAS
jgi:RNA polymerase sigma-70 factor, ECF subfamily